MPERTKTDQRKAQRYELRLPVELVRCGHIERNRQGETKNLSSSGVLFQSNAKFRIGEAVEYLIRLPSMPGLEGETLLRCLGKVVRCSRKAEVAVTLDRYEFLRDESADSEDAATA